MMTSSTPIDWRALSPLLASRMAAAGVHGYVYPFMPRYLASLGLPPNEVSYYAGLAEGLMPAMEGLFSLPAAVLCDRYERKPMLFLSVTWLCIISGCLGFNTSLSGIIICRILSGIDGVNVIARTMLYEQSVEDNRVRMYGVFHPVYFIGFSLASLIGGVLAEPAGRIPILGRLQIFDRFPFALPSLATAVIPGTAAVMTLLFAQETIAPAPTVKPQSQSAKSHLHDLLSLPKVPFITFFYCTYCVVDVGFTALFSLFAATAIESGGLGLSMPTIGIIMGCQTISYAVMTPLIAPRVANKLGMHRALTIFMMAWPVAALGFPVLTLFTKVPTILYTAFALNVLVRNVGGLGWMVTDLILAERVPTALRSTSIACAVVTASLGRCIGPATFSLVFGFSTLSDPFTIGRSIVWVVMFGASLSLLISAVTIERGRLQVRLASDDSNLALLSHHLEDEA